MAAPTDVVIAVSGLTKSYGSFEALRGIDLEVRRGEVLALVGENGAGKSTLANVISGIWEPNDGSVRVGGVDCAVVSSAFSGTRRHTARSPRGKVGFAAPIAR